METNPVVAYAQTEFRRFNALQLLNIALAGLQEPGDA